MDTTSLVSILRPILKRRQALWMGLLVLLGVSGTIRARKIIFKIINWALVAMNAYKFEQKRLKFIAAREIDSGDDVYQSVPSRETDTSLVVYEPKQFNTKGSTSTVTEVRKKFIFHIAAEVNVRMGARPKGAAQVRAARILAGRLMSEAGHRPTHIVRDLPWVIMAMHTPTEMELQMSDWFKTSLSDYGRGPKFVLALEASCPQ